MAFDFPTITSLLVKMKAPAVKLDPKTAKFSGGICQEKLWLGGRDEERQIHCNRGSLEHLSLEKFTFLLGSVKQKLQRTFDILGIVCNTMGFSTGVALD